MADKSAPPKLSRELLRALPKVELHCHLDGSLRPDTVWELAHEQGIKMPVKTAGELRALLTVPPDCPSLVDYLKCFDLPLMVLQEAYAITRVVFEVAEDAAQDGVKYIEIRFSPVLHTRHHLSLSRVMEAVCEGQVMAELNLPITVRIIVCGMRQMDPTVSKKLAEIAWRYRNRGVVAFDLAGPEHGYSSEIHRDAFDIIRSNCLNCTLHSGEAAGWEYVRDAVRYCGAQRIGHGVQLEQNAQLLQFFVDKGIPVEVCLTSNTQTKAVASLHKHPLRRYFDLGMVVVLCTDNPTVSGTTLTNEYHTAQELFGFTPVELVIMIDNGFRSAFLPMTMKSRLRAEALATCVRLLNDAGFDVGSAIIEKTARLGPALQFPAHVLSNVGKVSPTGRKLSLRSSMEVSLPPQDLAKFNVTLLLRDLGVVHHEKNMGRSSQKWRCQFTHDLIKAIPKTDLHCRLDGSPSIEWLWLAFQRKFNVERGNDKALPLIIVDNGETAVLPTLDEFCKFIQRPRHTKESIRLCKSLIQSVMQTRENILSALEDIYATAAADGITYMELMVRPHVHCREGALTPEEVVECVLGARDGLDERHCLMSGVVLYVVSDDDRDKQEMVQHIAELAVKNRNKGVCGFGIFGPDIDDTCVDSYFEFCPDTIKYLKDQSMDICIGAGRKEPDTVLAAIHDGGATRISGAFSIHRKPMLMEYMAANEIPIEIGLTDTARHYSEQIHMFAHPIQLFLDNHLLVSICSFDNSLYKNTRVESILEFVCECSLNELEVVRLLSVGFRRNFQPLRVRQQLYGSFWKEGSAALKRRGFVHLREARYFPQNFNNTQQPA